MNYTLDEYKELIEKIGFERATMYDLNKEFASKDYNKGYIGAYQYSANVLHLYSDKASLYFYDDVTASSILSFQRVSFDKSYLKLFKTFPKELRNLKIKNILEKLAS